MKTIRKKPPSWKYLKYLFWLGPMLVLAGVSAGVVSGTWDAVPLALLIAGLMLIGLWLLLQVWSQDQSMQSAGFWGRRSTQVSANALVATLAVVAILGFINFLGVRYTSRLDLTENQIFTLAPQTQQLVRTLKQPVKVWVFDPQQSPQDRELLESYRRQGKQFSFEFVNPEAQPTLAQQFEVKKLGDVIVEVQPNQRRQFVQNVNAQERLSEVKLTDAIERVTSDRQPRAYFIQGHGERPIEQARGAMTQAIQSLKDKNFTAQPLNLTETANFPSDATVVVLAGPQKPLLEPEVKALNTYVNQGGNLLVMVDANTNPGLDNLLTPWGVTLDNRTVIDVSGRLAELGPAYSSVTQYGDHPITRELGNVLSFYPLARPVDVKSVPNVTSTPLLFTTDRSWGESDIKNQPLKFDPQSDRPGPLVLGYALSRPVNQAAAPSKPAPSVSPTASPSPSASAQASPSPSPSASPTGSPSAQASSSPSPSASPTGSPSATSSPSPSISPSSSPTASASPSPAATASPSPSPSASPTAESDKKAESRLVVIGNSGFASDGLFGQGVNGDIFLNSMRWLSQDDQQSLSIRPKEAKNRRITLSEQQANLAGWLALAILPLLGFGTAFTVWWRRR